MKTVEKIYVENSRFIEFISEMATRLTEMNYGDYTYHDYGDEIKFTEEAQDFFNETYDDFEMMSNNIIGVYNATDEY